MQNTWINAFEKVFSDMFNKENALQVFILCAGALIIGLLAEKFLSKKKV